MDQKELGHQVRELRVRAGVQAKQLADALGLHPSGVSQIESGQRGIKAHELSVIAEVLGVSTLAILQPDSLLARMPVSARSSTGLIDEAVRNRLTRLVEFHQILSDEQITAPAFIEPPAVDTARWLPESVRLAQWARDRLSIEPGRFEDQAEAIRTELKVDVMAEPLEATSQMGAAITDPEFPFIFVNAAQPRSRALFTLAHELGHVLTGDGQLLYVDAAFSGGPAERFANAFAAELLLPRDGLLADLDAFGRSPRAIVPLMVKYQVSFDFLVNRFHNLRVFDAAKRDQLKSIGFGGLVAALEVDAETHADLLALSSNLDSTIPPLLLGSRLIEGYREGLVSARPVASVLGHTVDEVITMFRTNGPAQLDEEPFDLPKVDDAEWDALLRNFDDEVADDDYAYGDSQAEASPS